MQHAMAASLAGGVKRDVFFARARGYASSLEAALEPSHIPVEVYHNVVQTFRDNVSTWHRYWRIRREALGLEVLKPYDTRAQISSSGLKVPYEKAVDWIAEGVAPLGDEYVEVLRQGEGPQRDRKSTRLNSSHANISYAVFCLKKKKSRT